MGGSVLKEGPRIGCEGKLESWRGKGGWAGKIQSVCFGRVLELESGGTNKRREKKDKRGKKETE